MQRVTLLSVLFALLAGCAQPGAPNAASGTASFDTPAGTLIDPPKELADFTLRSHTGAPLSLSDLRGRPVLLFFGYTHCPDVCPMTMVAWKKVKTELGAAADDIAFVFVSVDGERDTPEVLAEFLNKYHSTFIGLSGNVATLRTVGKDYGLYFEHQKPGDDAAYLLEHV